MLSVVIRIVVVAVAIKIVGTADGVSFSSKPGRHYFSNYDTIL